MRRTDVLVIGGGQAGLAASYWLAVRGLDHAVLERGRVAERWRSATWDSLRMQTPRWQSRLPGRHYSGPDPHGYMSIAEVVAYLADYARACAAPVHEGVTVRAVRPHDTRYLVETDAGAWLARAVIIATGHCDVPLVPNMASRASTRVHQLAPARYRRPDALPPGGVLVVGGAASGVLIADELRGAGREVTIAVGGHTRVPRQHRGRDIYDWLDKMGVLRERCSDVRDVAAARRHASMQLVGDMPWRSLDLATLARRGVRLAGRLVDLDGETAHFADDLERTIADADARAARLVERIDVFAAAHSILADGPRAELAPVAPPPGPRVLDLARERISTVVWATGFRRDYSWLHVPAALAAGELAHDRGVTPAPGLYALGLRFMRCRNSSFLDGVGADAHDIVDHLARWLDRRDAA